MNAYKLILFFILSFACFVLGFFVGQNYNVFNDKQTLQNRFSENFNSNVSSTNTWKHKDYEEPKTEILEKFDEESYQKNKEYMERLKKKLSNDIQIPYSNLEKKSLEDLKKKTIKVKKDIAKKQREYDKKNRQWLLSIAKDQSNFYFNGKYSFLVNIFSDENKAVKYIENIKIRYPLWNFFIKVDKLANIKIYLGPFDTRQRALNFIKTMPHPSPFPNHFLEEKSL